jgi:hypothetical protein
MSEYTQCPGYSSGNVRPHSIHQPNQVLTRPVKLKGAADRCQRPSCREYFNSTKAFDSHRVGQFGVGRRCLASAEMTVKGMAQSAGGFWLTQKMPLGHARRRKTADISVTPGVVGPRRLLAVLRPTGDTKELRGPAVIDWVSARVPIRSASRLRTGGGSPSPPSAVAA